MGRLQLAPVARGLSDFEAKVVTARLGADGILWELRGVVDGIYPFGRIDVLVPVDELEAARTCLRADGEAELIDGDGPDGPAGAGGLDGYAGTGAGGDGDRRAAGTAGRWWVTVAVVAGVVAFSVLRTVAGITWLDDGVDDCSPQAAAEGLTPRCRP